MNEGCRCVAEICLTTSLEERRVRNYWNFLRHRGSGVRADAALSPRALETAQRLQQLSNAQSADFSCRICGKTCSSPKVLSCHLTRAPSCRESLSQRRHDEVISGSSEDSGRVSTKEPSTGDDDAQSCAARSGFASSLHSALGCSGPVTDDESSQVGGASSQNPVVVEDSASDSEAYLTPPLFSQAVEDSISDAGIEPTPPPPSQSQLHSCGDSTTMESDSSRTREGNLVDGVGSPQSSQSQQSGLSAAGDTTESAREGNLADGTQRRTSTGDTSENAREGNLADGRRRRDPTSSPRRGSQGPVQRPSVLRLAREDLNEESKERFQCLVDETVAPYLGKSLDDSQWEEFEVALATCMDDIVSLCETSISRRQAKTVGNKSAQHWKRRQQARENSRSSQPSTSSGSSQRGGRNAGGTAPPSSSTRRSGQEANGRTSASRAGSRHPPRGNRRRTPRVPEDAAKRDAELKRLFTSNRRKAMDRVFEREGSPFCPIDTDTLTQFWSEESAPKQLGSDEPSWFGDLFPPQDPDDPQGDSLRRSILPDEVQRQLQRVRANSAPGPDRLTYGSWRSLDPKGTLLAGLFETCRLSRKIPRSWKESGMVLLHKKGRPAEEPRSWRPINLQQSIYKIYAAVLAKRLMDWAMASGSLSEAQKGFLPFEGCHEHNFTLRAMFETCRRRRGKLACFWLDLRNAFGSVPHDLLFLMLERLGIPAEIREIVRDIYCESTFCVRSARGLSAPIESQRGVKQGCPLSPILFNFALEGLLRGLTALRKECGFAFSDQLRVNSLAFADDLGVFADSESALAPLIQRVEEFLSWSGVSPNVAKCGSLSFGYVGGRLRVSKKPFCLQGALVPTLGWDDRYKYLGTPVGFDTRADLESPTRTYRDRVRLICKSGLADWQKLIALKQYAIPVLDFHLRNCLAFEKWGEDTDRFTRRLLKKSLGLPVRTAVPFFYASQDSGGLGLSSVRESISVTQVVQVVKLLISRDPAVRGIALQQLDEVIAKRARIIAPSNDQRIAFLNGELRLDNESAQGDVKSLWSVVRKAAKKIGVRFVPPQEPEDGWFTLSSVDTDAWLSQRQLRGHLLALLRQRLAQRWLGRWKDLKDQGKVARAASCATASNAWLKDCRFLRYREYRWALKARLDLLPVAAVRRKWVGFAHDPINPACVSCGSDTETLPHILNHCPPRMEAIRSRHNTILERLKNAVPKNAGVVPILDQKLPDCPLDLRVDLQLVDHDNKQATLVDVAIPFDNGREALSEVRRLKEEKYARLAEWLVEEKGFRDVFVGAFVVGSLGSYDPDNEDVLDHLGVRQGYRPLFRRLCVIDSIRGSYKIWCRRCVSTHANPG